MGRDSKLKNTIKLYNKYFDSFFNNNKRLQNTMITPKDLEQITNYLVKSLSGYEVIPANWGWHIHKGDTYCGKLEYQRAKGWQGKALSYLPSEIRKQLKNLAN